MRAVRWGRSEVFSMLLEAGANIDLQNKVECRGNCWEVWNEVLDGYEIIHYIIDECLRVASCR